MEMYTGIINGTNCNVVINGVTLGPGMKKDEVKNSGLELTDEFESRFEPERVTVLLKKTAQVIGEEMVVQLIFDFDELHEITFEPTEEFNIRNRSKLNGRKPDLRVLIRFYNELKKKLTALMSKEAPLCEYELIKEVDFEAIVYEQNDSVIMTLYDKNERKAAIVLEY